MIGKRKNELGINLKQYDGGISYKYLQDNKQRKLDRKGSFLKLVYH